MNRIFLILFLITAVVGGFFLIQYVGSLFLSLKSSKLLSRPIKYYRRRAVASLIMISITFYGFYTTQPSTVKLSYEIALEEKVDEILNQDSRVVRQRAEEITNYNTPRNENPIDENITRASRAEESGIELGELDTGWNKETANVEVDSANWEKATDLVKKYPNYIRDSQGDWISASAALEKPWDYYGKVINFSGKIYSIQKLPPESSVAQFFDDNCYHAMLVVNDNNKPVTISVYIVGDSEYVEENSVVNVKGYIYGQSRLTTGAGTSSNGLAFVGFKD